MFTSLMITESVSPREAKVTIGTETNGFTVVLRGGSEVVSVTIPRHLAQALKEELDGALHRDNVRIAAEIDHKYPTGTGTKMSAFVPGEPIIVTK